jgi:hypothetical protein
VPGGAVQVEDAGNDDRPARDAHTAPPHRRLCARIWEYVPDSPTQVLQAEHGHQRTENSTLATKFAPRRHRGRGGSPAPGAMA